MLSLGRDAGELIDVGCLIPCGVRSRPADGELAEGSELIEGDGALPGKFQQGEEPGDDHEAIPRVRDERGLSQSTENAILLAGAAAIALVVITAITAYVTDRLPS